MESVNEASKLVAQALEKVEKNMRDPYTEMENWISEVHRLLEKAMDALITKK